jgi:N-acylneuraminate cytidylyltransferase/CMP-N,N'-diacetyllegionaminic acid synthase
LKILAIIPARGGSKGIPNKNIINLNDKPLIQYTIEAAKNSQKIDRIFLSSDNNEIIKTARKLGVNSRYIRPSHLANDTATAVDVVLDALIWLKENENYVPDAVLLLQPTSPLRISEDIDQAIKQFVLESTDSLVSVHKMIEHPNECVFDIENKDWKYLAKENKNATRRQDYKNDFYYINGALYLANVNFFKKEKVFIKEKNTSFYVMPHERGIDIDEYYDLDMARMILQREKK